MAGEPPRATSASTASWTPASNLVPVHERLCQWVTAAAAHPPVEEALERVRCPDRADGPEALGERFRQAFRYELNKNPDTQFRVNLIAQLAADESARAYQKKELAESAAALGIASLTAGGATFGVVDIAAGTDSDTAVAIGAAAALLVAGGGAAVNALRPGATPVQKVVRDAARVWLADFLSALLSTARPHAGSTADELQEAVMAALEQETAGDGTAAVARPPPELVKDLSERLIRRSREAGDERLTVALYQLEDRLVRWQRDTEQRRESVRRDIYPAVLELIEAVRIP